MASTNASKGARIQIGLGMIGALALLILSSVPAFAQETGNYCVADYQPGAVCTANDVRIEQMQFVKLIEGCNEGTIGQLEAQFEVLVSADGSPDRYDIGLFFDLSGSPGGARDGDLCYHTYLATPLTASPVYGDANGDTIPDIRDGPWWDGDSDTCGDIESDTQVITTLATLTLSCANNNPDPSGGADIHYCASWDNNAGTSCSAVTEAFPGTNSKCSCGYVELPFTPTQIELLALQAAANDEKRVGALIGVALAGLFLPSAIALRVRGRKRSQS